MDKIWRRESNLYTTYPKMFMPGIALAFMIPPRKFMEKFVLIKYGLDPNLQD